MATPTVASATRPGDDSIPTPVWDVTTIFVLASAKDKGSIAAQTISRRTVAVVTSST